MYDAFGKVFALQIKRSSLLPCEQSHRVPLSQSSNVTEVVSLRGYSAQIINLLNIDFRLDFRIELQVHGRLQLKAVLFGLAGIGSASGYPLEDALYNIFND